VVIVQQKGEHGWLPITAFILAFLGRKSDATGFHVSSLAGITDGTSQILGGGRSMLHIMRKWVHKERKARGVSRPLMH
jgi:hypothetical protein